MVSIFEHSNFAEVIRCGDWTTHSICPENALFMKLQLCQLMAVFQTSNIFYFCKFYRAFVQTAQLSAQSTAEYVIGVPQDGNYLLDLDMQGRQPYIVWCACSLLRQESYEKNIL